MKIPLIQAPNFTQIPNVVFDYWMPRLKPTEGYVLLILCRKIFGWHKTSDSISANQLVKTTGLSKPTVIAALKELETLGLITKTQSVGQYGCLPNEFKLKLTVPEDELYTDKTLEEMKEREGGGSQNSLQGVVKNFNQGVVKDFNPQKKDLTKERLTKEREGASTPALTSSSSNENKIERLPLVFTSEVDHQKLIDKYGAEITQQCYQKLSEWKLDTPKSKWKKDDYRSILRWVFESLKEEKARKSKVQVDINTPEENKKFAANIADNFNPVRCPERGIRIEVLSKHIEFVHTRGHQQPICINYTEKGFKEQVENSMRKLRLY